MFIFTLPQINNQISREKTSLFLKGLANEL